MALTLGKCYSRREISDMLGGSTIAYLPTAKGRVVCGCFKPEPRWNPGAPEKVVFGPGPKVRQTAELVARQNAPIPIFLFRKSAAWEYVGDYRCVGINGDPRSCQQEERKNTRRGEIRGILFFEKDSSRVSAA